MRRCVCIINVAVTFLVSVFAPGPALGDEPPSSPVQLGTERFQTRGFAFDLAFSPDSRFVAVAEANSPERAVRVFRVDSGATEFVLSDAGEEPASIYCLAFSPDGTSLLCGDYRGGVTLWDLASRSVKVRKKTHKSQIHVATYSPNGEWWATADATGRVELRMTQDDGKQGRILAFGKKRNGDGDFVSRSTGVVSMCFTNDNQQLMIASPEEGGAISMLDVEEGTQLWTTKLGAELFGNPAVTYVGLLPKANEVISAGQKTVPQWKTSIKYGPKNVTLTQLRVWNAKSGEHVRDLHSQEQFGFGQAALSPNGTELVVADFGVLSSRSVSSGEVNWATKLPGTWGSKPVWSPDGQLIAMKFGGGIALFDGATGKQRFHDGNKGSEVDIASWSRDGKTIVSSHRDGFLRLWNATAGALRFEQEFAPVISASGRKARVKLAALSNDGSRIFATGTHDNPVDWRNGLFACIDVETGERLFTRNFKRRIQHGGVSPDGKTAVVATSNGSLGDRHLYGIDLASGELVFSTYDEEQVQGLWSVEAIAFDEASTLFRIATGNSEIVTFDLASGKELNRVSVDFRTTEQKALNKPKWSQLWEGDFDKYANTLVSSSAEHLYVWNGATGNQQAKYLMKHPKGCKLGTSPDGSLVAIADLQYSGEYGVDEFRIIDTNSGEIVTTIPTLDTRPEIFVFSPDGTKLFTGMRRGSACIWNVTGQSK